MFFKSFSENENMHHKHTHSEPGTHYYYNKHDYHHSVMSGESGDSSCHTCGSHNPSSTTSPTAPVPKGPSPFTPKQYNANTYRDSSSHNRTGLNEAGDHGLVRILDGDFQREGSPVSVSTCSTHDLDLTVASSSKDSKSSMHDLHTGMMPAYKDLDTSGEQEVGGFSLPSAVSDRDIYHRSTSSQAKTPFHHKSTTDLTKQQIPSRRKGSEDIFPKSPSKSKSLDNLFEGSGRRRSYSGGPDMASGARLQLMPDKSRSRPTTPTHTRPLKGMKECPQQINSARLRPIRQKTRNAVVRILS